MKKKKKYYRRFLAKQLYFILDSIHTVQRCTRCKNVQTKCNSAHWVDSESKLFNFTVYLYKYLGMSCIDVKGNVPQDFS